jgi:hypothetical protein
MDAEEYTDAYIQSEIRNLKKEYQQGVSPERLVQLITRIKLLKMNGLKSTVEEEDN